MFGGQAKNILDFSYKLCLLFLVEKGGQTFIIQGSTAISETTKSVTTGFYSRL